MVHGRELVTGLAVGGACITLLSVVDAPSRCEHYSSDLYHGGSKGNSWVEACKHDIVSCQDRQRSAPVCDNGGFSRRHGNSKNAIAKGNPLASSVEKTHQLSTFPFSVVVTSYLLISSYCIDSGIVGSPNFKGLFSCDPTAICIASQAANNGLVRNVVSCSLVTIGPCFTRVHSRREYQVNYL